MTVNNDTPADKEEGDEQEYDSLLELEELESLLEDLEDLGITRAIVSEKLPGDLADLARSLNVKSLQEIRDRIAALHGALDNEEFD